MVIRIDVLSSSFHTPEIAFASRRSRAIDTGQWMGASKQAALPSTRYRLPHRKLGNVGTAQRPLIATDIVSS